MNDHMGKLNNIDKFDGSFFKILQVMANSIDPQGRLLMEATYEAICDAGMKFNDCNFINF